MAIADAILSIPASALILGIVVTALLPVLIHRSQWRVEPEHLLIFSSNWGPWTAIRLLMTDKDDDNGDTPGFWTVFMSSSTEKEMVDPAAARELELKERAAFEDSKKLSKEENEQAATLAKAACIHHLIEFQKCQTTASIWNGTDCNAIANGYFSCYRKERGFIRSRMFGVNVDLGSYVPSGIPSGTAHDTPDDGSGGNAVDAEPSGDGGAGDGGVGSGAAAAAAAAAAVDMDVPAAITDGIVPIGTSTIGAVPTEMPGATTWRAYLGVDWLLGSSGSSSDDKGN